jgi:hypothetical protein
MLSTRVPKIAQTKIYVLRLRGLSKKEKLLFFINSYQAVSAFVYVYEIIKRGMFNLIPLLPKQNIDFLSFTTNSHPKFYFVGGGVLTMLK